MTATGADGGMPSTDLLLRAVLDRTTSIVEALRPLDDAALRGASHLPGWDRLTLACHLRYGAEALLRMTNATLAREQTAFYPGGREGQRSATLEPRAGESAVDVVASFGETSAALHETWSELECAQWKLEIIEPDGGVDLGPLPLHRLLLLRLTEVEVHGSDLDVGVEDWSDVLIDAALPFRIGWLNTRPSNHRQRDHDVEGTWLLRATDGPSWTITVSEGGVSARPAIAHERADAVIEASRRDLLALLLGRPFRTDPLYRGDLDLAHAFHRAFPGP